MKEPTDETRERFLSAIAERLDPFTIAEAHLFPPIRQGGLESGVAVVAVRRPHVNEHGDLSAGEVIPPLQEDGASVAEVPDDTLDEVNAAEEEADVEAARAVVEEADQAMQGEPEITGSTRDDPGTRLTVYTAKYRLTLKGADRGKWEFALQAEADAPLLTVDKVVRGVQQRSGDAEDPVKITGEEFRALLPARSGS